MPIQITLEVKSLYKIGELYIWLQQFSECIERKYPLYKSKFKPNYDKFSPYIFSLNRKLKKKEKRLLISSPAQSTANCVA